MNNDDMTWKCFLHYWPFVTGKRNQWSLWIPSHKGDVIWSFHVSLNMLSNKQWSCWWLGTLEAYVMSLLYFDIVYNLLCHNRSCYKEVQLHMYVPYGHIYFQFTFNPGDGAFLKNMQLELHFSSFLNTEIVQAVECGWQGSTYFAQSIA